MALPPKDIQFNIMLSAEEKAQLLEAAHREALPSASIFRRALKNYFRMAVTHIPTCANGNPCFVPQMHPIPPPPPRPDPDTTPFP